MGAPVVNGAARPLPESGHLEALFGVVRPEFRGEVLRAHPDDPVFGRGRCEVTSCERTAWTRKLCSGHYQRWCQHGREELTTFRATTGPISERRGGEMLGAFDLRALSAQGRLEVGYVLQRRHDDRGVRVVPSVVRHLVHLLVDSGVDSVLELPLEHWLDEIVARGWRDLTTSMIRYAYRELTDLRGIDLEAEYASDVWVAKRLGITRARAPYQIRFDQITQPWLRVAVKRWVRHRIGSGRSFGTTGVDVRSMVWFSEFLATRQPSATDETSLRRRDLEAYLGHLVASRLTGHTVSTYIICVRIFLEASQRQGWLPGLVAEVAIYNDDIPRRPRALPRYIPEFVMHQLEAPDNLDRLPDHGTRALVVVLMETGLRANDACALLFDALVSDSGGGPCLRFFNAKMRADQLIPLSAAGATAVRDQQAHLRLTWPDGPRVLFPAPNANPDGDQPFNYATLRGRLVVWQDEIDLRDEAGRPVRVSAHRFRHTLGTRLINQGVPQHVVQRLLGHASPQMTARYASLHDATIREAFDAYWAQRINVLGQQIGFDPGASTADAEWMKHNLARIQASLPNGYCGRPPQQECPHPNACLTCPDFQTTPEFLEIHRRQHAETRQLIASADADGRFRLAANHRRVLENLEHVINALETTRGTST